MLLTGLIVSCERLKELITQEQIVIKAKQLYEDNYNNRLKGHPLFYGSPDWENPIIKDSTIYIPLSLEIVLEYQEATTAQIMYARSFLQFTQSYDVDFEENLIVFFSTTLESSTREFLSSPYYALYHKDHIIDKNLPFNTIREVPRGSNYEVQNTCECDSLDVIIPIMYNDGICRDVLLYSYELCYNYLEHYRAYARGGSTSDFGDFMK